MTARVEALAAQVTIAQPAWDAFASHTNKVSQLRLRRLVADDPKRGERMAIEAAGLYLDYSKNRVTDETLRLHFQLAEESGLRARIHAMFSGEKIIITEKRAVEPVLNHDSSTNTPIRRYARLRSRNDNNWHDWK
jgi:glucose-6-phosphate isomerase